MAGFDEGFIEVGERVWVARYEPHGVNVCVVEGERGLVVVDTATTEAAPRLLEDLRRLSSRPLVGIVNTHAHVDHVQGNPLLRESYDDAPVTAHEAALIDPPADRTFSSVGVVDLGDRALELIHPGRGHTDGDVVVRLEEADVVLAGDLVEESGHPSYGEDSFPLEWPLSLDLVLGLTTPGTVVVPGHGEPVGQGFVQEQRAAIGVVAETVRDLAGRGVPVGEALAAGQWPYPAEELAAAVTRGYEQLPRSQKRLPLL